MHEADALPPPALEEAMRRDALRDKKKKKRKSKKIRKRIEQILELLFNGDVEYSEIEPCFEDILGRVNFS